MSFGSAVFLYFIYGELYAKLDYGILRCIYGFGLGAITWDIFRKAKGKIRQDSFSKNTAYIVEASILILSIIYIYFFSEGALSMAAPLVFSVLVFIFAFERGKISRVLSFRPFVFIGMLSYSIYMIHLFISGKFFALPIRILENRFGWHITVNHGGLDLYGENLYIGTALEIFYLLTVICLSFVSYKLIEEPCRNWTKNKIK